MSEANEAGNCLLTDVVRPVAQFVHLCQQLVDLLPRDATREVTLEDDHADEAVQDEEGRVEQLPIHLDSNEEANRKEKPGRVLPQGSTDRLSKFLCLNDLIHEALNSRVFPQPIPSC